MGEHEIYLLAKILKYIFKIGAQNYKEDEKRAHYVQMFRTLFLRSYEYRVIGRIIDSKTIANTLKKSCQVKYS